MFSKTCEHGIKATIYIANKTVLGLRVKVPDVAQQINSPAAYTAKILQTLVRQHIVLSRKGPQGGFEIDPEKLEIISLKDIVYAIDGDRIYNGCGLGLESCDSDNPCPVHYKFLAIRSDLKQMLERTTLHELATDFAAGTSILRFNT